MGNKENIRNSNIELLRILLILFVIILHYNGMGASSLKYVKTYSFDYFWLNFFEAFSVCAVDCFIIISGYFLAFNKKINFFKVINLYSIIIVYNFFSFFLQVFLGLEKISLFRICYCFLPFNYFFIFYSIIYIFSPFTNIIFNYLESKRKSLWFLGIVSIVFVLYPMMLDILRIILGINCDGLSSIAINGSSEGYNIVNFFVMYCIGVFLRRFNISMASCKAFLFYVISSTVLFILWVFQVPLIKENYYSVFIIVPSIFLFLGFNSLSFSSKIINFLSKSVFGIFCLHTSVNFVWVYFNAEKWISEGNGVVHMFISVSLMFLSCLVLDVIFRGILFPIKSFLSNKISKKITFSLV